MRAGVLAAALCQNALHTVVLLPETLARSLTFPLCRQHGLHSSRQAQGEEGGELGAVGSGVERSGSAAPWLSLIFSFQLGICKTGILTDSML